jgi:PAS domain S-box-containing protein
MLQQIRAWLPEGRALPNSVWEQRHRFVLGFVFLHAVGLAIFGLVQGWSPYYALGEGGLIAGIGLLASWKKLGRTFRSACAAFAAAMTSAVLTQFWGGYIEAHFHYFIVVALIAFYQDWTAFLLAIGFVAFDHGLLGSVVPEWVYNHPDAVANPWRWAAIHAALVLGECVILIRLWKANEEARARTDLVLQSASDGILGLDLNGRVTFANSTASKMLNLPAAQIVDSSIQQVMAGSSDKPTQLAVGELLLASNGAPAKGRGTAVIERDGQKTPLDWNLNIVTEHGLTVGSVLTLSDATERVRAEDEHSKRIQQYSELEHLKELDKFKTLFINTAAHELHTPLTPLRLHVYALKEGHRGELNPEQMSTVDVLDRNVERLSQLVEDVLNVARLQASKMVLQKADVDITELVHQAVDSFQEPARHNDVKIEAHLEPGLVTKADGKRITQVLYNLLDNAVKFTPKGGSIRVDAMHGQSGALVRVKDSGVGIPKGELEKLFQPFSQAHSPMERTDAGSGLGLYISKGIIDLHGGHISGRSDGVGLGSTFEFVIPLTNDAGAARDVVAPKVA